MARNRNRGRGMGSMRDPAVMSGSTGRSARRRSTRNWLVSSYSADTTGGEVTSIGDWGAFSAALLAPGSNMTYLLTAIKPAPATSTPGVGAQRIDHVKGRIYVAAAADKLTLTVVPGPAYLAVGIYVSELNTTTTKWNVRQLSSITDAERDDYHYLEGKVFNLQDPRSALPNSMPDIEAPHFDIDLPLNVEIGGGEALALTIASDAFSYSANGVYITPYLRCLVGPVA